MKVADPAYSVPGMMIIVMDSSEGATLSDVLPIGLEDPDTDIQSTGTASLSDGTAVETAWLFYLSGTTQMEAEARGFIKDDKWFIMVVFTIGSYWPMADQYPDEILSTWTFD